MLSALKIGVKHGHKHVGGGEGKDDPDRYHHVPERQVNIVIFQPEISMIIKTIISARSGT